MPGETESLSRVRLRIGPELHVVDVSDHGVLVEAAARLLPGARVDLHVVGRHGPREGARHGPRGTQRHHS